jgi:hypothetical protein
MRHILALFLILTQLCALGASHADVLAEEGTGFNNRYSLDELIVLGYDLAAANSDDPFGDVSYDDWHRIVDNSVDFHLGPGTPALWANIGAAEDVLQGPDEALEHGGQHCARTGTSCFSSTHERARSTLITGLVGNAFLPSTNDAIVGELALGGLGRVFDLLSTPSTIANATRTADNIIDAARAGDTGSVDAVIVVPRHRYPESARHIEDAQSAGHPSVLTIDRAGAASNRRESLRGVEPQPGLDRDEYPPAMFEEGGAGASVRPINPSDNRGAGSCIGHQCRGLPDGSTVEIIVE